jgi:predicted acylesterase/phospholipase RssA
MTSPRHLLSLAALPLIAFATVESQTQEALVLSGGGSRGLSHVGVLIGLDSLNHDPDLVIGASMGAIVGSLYAAGYTSSEIRRIAREQDWRDLFKPVPLVFGPRREIRLPLLHFGAELGRFEVSRGFLPDWRINRRLVEYLFDAGARARGNFDLLPRRYRSVAADRRDGDTVVIARGDLARSVRASMAEPGIFSPVLWNERVLIDGGIADYLPVIIARNYGASTVIASDVMRSELEATPRDPIGLLRRALTLLMVRARQDTTLPTYLVVPKIDPKQSGLVYPDDVEPMIRLGVDATLHTVPHSTTRARTRTPRLPPESLTRLVIESRDRSLAALTRAVFKDVAPAKYSAANVLAAVDRMYASGFTESVWPRVDSAGTLIVHVDSRSNGSLDAAVGYDNDRGGRAWGSAQRRFSTTGAPTELELSGSITGFEQWGSLSVRRASLWLPPVVWAASGYVRETHARFVRDADSTAEREVARAGGWIGIERRAVFPDHIITASFLAERITEEGTTRTSVGPMLTFGIPEADRVVGVTPGIEVERRFGEWDYSRAAARGSLGLTRRRFKLAVVADGAITDKDAPADALPALGDDRAMPGTRWGQERGRARAVAGLDAAYPIPVGGHIRLRARAGAAPLTLRGFESSHNWVLGAEIGGVWSLPVGSIILAGGFNSRGRSRFDILVGQVF